MKKIIRNSFVCLVVSFSLFQAVASEEMQSPWTVSDTEQECPAYSSGEQESCEKPALPPPEPKPQPPEITCSIASRPECVQSCMMTGKDCVLCDIYCGGW